MTGGTTTSRNSHRGLRGGGGRLAAGLLAGAITTGATAQIVPVEPKWELADLGTLGGQASMALGMNDLLVQSASLPPVPMNDSFPELLEANAINENGDVVAVGTNGQDDLVRTYLLQPVDSFDPYRPRFTYMDTGYLPAAVPSQSRFRPTSIGDQAVDQTGQPVTGPSVTVGLGLNDLGQVVGASAEQAFVWRGNVLDGLLEIGQTSQANAISDWGLIVGWTAGPAGRPHASLWSVWMPDLVWGLCASAGWTSEAVDVNGYGEAVGWSAADPQGDNAVAMMWTGSVAWGLNEFTAVPEGPVFWDTLEEATAINEQHQIAGYGRLTDGNVRAFVLDPIEPDPNADPGD